MELATLVLHRPEGRGIEPLLAPRLGNAQAFGLAFRSLYVANKLSPNRWNCWGILIRRLIWQTGILVLLSW